jgi:signal transduction histidine kinase
MRVIGLALIVVSVIHADHRPGGHGRGLVITVLLAAAVFSWLWWTIRPTSERITPDLWVMAGAGGLLCAASPDSAASAFVFVAVVSAGVRVELAQAVWVTVAGTVALAIGDIIYGNVGVGLLAYTLGFAASVLAASTSRQSAERVEQAELLLAQTQRSHEEQLRAARLEESTRIAREIHDVLAHALAGLTIQLEATTSLIERGADRAEVLARVQRAHELARDGLRETRLAVGALRGDPVSAPSGIEALVTDYRAGADAEAELTIDGDVGRLAGPTGQAVLRVVQEALPNVRKHAPGAAVSVAVHAGARPGDEVVAVRAGCRSGRRRGSRPACGPAPARRGAHGPAHAAARRRRGHAPDPRGPA